MMYLGLTLLLSLVIFVVCLGFKFSGLPVEVLGSFLLSIRLYFKVVNYLFLFSIN